MARRLAVAAAAGALATFGAGLGAATPAVAASPSGGAPAESERSSGRQVDPERRGGGAAVEAKRPTRRPAARRRRGGAAPAERATPRRPRRTPRAPEVLEQIAACESGGDPTAVSPDGRFRGKYQFSLETWRSVGGSGDPAAAPEAEQDRRALALFRREGLAPWPHCGRGAQENL